MRSRPLGLLVRVRALPLVGLLVLSAVAVGCGAPDAPTALRVRTAPAPALPDSTFGRLVRELSGPGGYFDTDNLISNETSYLHVLGPLRELGLEGGVYVGVGPDQSYSYIGRLRPRMAFIIDIRRDNLLEHLLFKAIFAAAATPAEYLALLLGLPSPPASPEWSDRGVDEVVEWLDATPATRESAAAARAVVDSLVAGFGVELSDEDLATIRRFHDAFMEQGLDLRFRSHGRAPRSYYPTLRQLVLETDLEGERGSYLADPASYRVVRDLHARNLVVPVVGDLAGEHALPAIARELRERGEAVTALYTSNVEFYLWQDGTFGRFARNVRELPLASDAVLIRSYFPGRYGRHPRQAPGYWSTQTLHPLDDFVRITAGEGYAGYRDLVTRDVLPR